MCLVRANNGLPPCLDKNHHDARRPAIRARQRLLFVFLVLYQGRILVTIVQGTISQGVKPRIKRTYQVPGTRCIWYTPYNTSYQLPGTGISSCSPVSLKVYKTRGEQKKRAGTLLLYVCTWYVPVCTRYFDADGVCMM